MSIFGILVGRPLILHNRKKCISWNLRISTHFVWVHPKIPQENWGILGFFWGCPRNLGCFGGYPRILGYFGVHHSFVLGELDIFHPRKLGEIPRNWGDFGVTSKNWGVPQKFGVTHHMAPRCHTTHNKKTFIYIIVTV